MPQNPSPADTLSSIAPSPSRRRPWLSAIKALLLAAALGYVAWNIVKSIRDVRAGTLEFHIDIGWLAASAALILATYALLIRTWLYIVTELSGKTLPYGIAARIWFVSNLGRYIPGKVWQIVQMGLMSTEQGIDAVSSSAAAIINAAVQVAVGLAVAVVAGAPIFDRILQPFGYAWLSRTVAVAAVVCVVLLPFLLPPMLRVLRQRFGVGAPLERPPIRAIVVSVVANVIAWVSYGAAFQCLIHGVLGTAPGNLIDYTAAFAASYVIGYLAILVPGGIGVREYLLAVILPAAALATAEQAAAISVASRLWLVVIEIAPALLFLAYRRRPPDEKSTAG